MPHPTTAQIEAADLILNPSGQYGRACFRGGHVYSITDAIAAELTTAGYVVL